MTAPVYQGDFGNNSGGSGAFNGAGGTIGTCSFGLTVAATEYCLLAIAWESASAVALSSVVAGGTSGLTWTKVGSTLHQTASNGFYMAIELWEATGTVHTGSGDTVVCTFASAVDHAACAGQFFTGVNATPFDANPSLGVPEYTLGSSSVASISVTTSNPDDYILGICSTSDNASVGNFTLGGSAAAFNNGVDNSSGGSQWCRLAVGGLPYTATQSGLAVANGASATNTIMVAVALTADGPSAPFKPIRTHGIIIN